MKTSLRLSLLMLLVGPLGVWPQEISAASAVSPTPWVILEVGLVRISPTRPGTSRTWDQPKEEKEEPLCFVIGLVALVSGGTMQKAVAESVCDALMDTNTQAAARPATDPDVFIKLVGGPKTTLQSHIVSNALSPHFRFRAVLPLDATPVGGFELLVLNESDGTDGESSDVIGSFRLDRRQLETAAESGQVLQLREGGVERLELTVGYLDPSVHTRTSQAIQPNPPRTMLASTEVIAGQIVALRARGRYWIEQSVVDTTGSGSTSKTLPTLRGMFSKAPFGATIALIGKGGAFDQVVVGKCTSVLARHGGRIEISFNARNVGRAFGTRFIDVVVRNPTRFEWLKGAGMGDCNRLAGSLTAEDADWAQEAAKKVSTYLKLPSKRRTGAASRLKKGALTASDTSLAEKIARSIQEITHPTGTSPRLVSVTARAVDGNVVALFQVAWKGGLTNHQYTTVVTWEFARSGHILASVSIDTGPVLVAGANAQQLDEFFRKTVYPATASHA